MPNSISQVQPPLEFIPPAYNPLVMQGCQQILPWWLRFRTDISHIQAENVEIQPPTLHPASKPSLPANTPLVAAISDEYQPHSSRKRRNPRRTIPPISESESSLLASLPPPQLRRSLLFGTINLETRSPGGTGQRHFPAIPGTFPLYLRSRHSPVGRCCSRLAVFPPRRHSDCSR